MVTEIYPSLEQLGRPDAIKKNIMAQDVGITLISGKPSSGVTTTIAALGNEIKNQNYDVIHLRFGDDEELPGIDSISMDDDDMQSAWECLIQNLPHLIIIDNLTEPSVAALAYQLAQEGSWVVVGMHANSEDDAIQTFLGLASRAMQYDSVMNLMIRTSVYQSFVAPQFDNESRRVRILANYCLRNIMEMMHELNPDRIYLHSTKKDLDLNYKILITKSFL